MKQFQVWHNVYDDGRYWFGVGNKSRKHADLANRYNETKTRRRIGVWRVTYKMSYRDACRRENEKMMVLLGKEFSQRISKEISQRML